ncbi:MAG: tetratricopeptide repeat protein [Anaerolineales bacterium]|nr:tetratricopeptide repeat protein [Anaerolineales bacterium]
MIFSVDDQAQALHTLDYALQQPEIWPETRSLLLELAPLMEQAGYRDEWQPYLEQGLTLSRWLADREAEAELALQLGVLGQLRSDYAAARQYLEASKQRFETLNNSLNLARALNHLAYVACLQRQFQEAIHLVETALSLLHDQAGESAFSYFVLGAVALDQGHWAKAETFLRQAHHLWQQVDNKRMQGRCLMGLCAALRPQEKYQAALEAGQQAVAMFEAVHDPVQRAISQMNLGNVYLMLEQPHQALELYQPAERIFRQVHDLFHLAHINHTLGMAYRHLGEWATAEAAYRRSLDYQEKLGNLAWLVNTLDGLGLVYLTQGQLTPAITTFEMALERLMEIKGQSGYDSLRHMLVEHLHEAQSKINLENTSQKPV